MVYGLVCLYTLLQAFLLPQAGFVLLRKNCQNDCTEMRKVKITDKIEIAWVGSSVTQGFSRENTSMDRQGQSQVRGC